MDNYDSPAHQRLEHDMQVGLNHYFNKEFGIYRAGDELRAWRANRPRTASTKAWWQAFWVSLLLLNGVTWNALDSLYLDYPGKVQSMWHNALGWLIAWMWLRWLVTWNKVNQQRQAGPNTPQGPQPPA